MSKVSHDTKRIQVNLRRRETVLVAEMVGEILKAAAFYDVQSLDLLLVPIPDLFTYSPAWACDDCETMRIARTLLAAFRHC